MPRLWTHLDFSRAKKPVKLTAVRACVERSKGGITHATLHYAATTCALKHVLKCCRALHHLEVNQGFTSTSLREAASLAQNLSTLIVSKYCMVDLDVVTRMLSLCSKLERAEFHRIYVVGEPPQWQISGKIRRLTLTSPSVEIVWNLVCMRNRCVIRSLIGSTYSIPCSTKYHMSTSYACLRPYTRLRSCHWASRGY